MIRAIVPDKVTALTAALAMTAALLAPMRGEHTEAVVAEVGVSPEAIESVRAAGVIR